MKEPEKFTGTILIVDSKVVSVELETPDREMLEIDKIITMKTIIDQYMIDYEKDYKRS